MEPAAGNPNYVMVPSAAAPAAVEPQSQLPLAVTSTHNCKPPLFSFPRRPALRVTSEFDSESAVFFHKISCKLLDNLAKFKLQFNHSGKGDIAEPQISFVSKHLSLHYDLEDHNALVKTSIDVGPRLQLTAAHDVKVLLLPLHHPIFWFFTFSPLSSFSSLGSTRRGYHACKHRPSWLFTSTINTSSIRWIGLYYESYYLWKTNAKTQTYYYYHVSSFSCFNSIRSQKQPSDFPLVRFLCKRKKRRRPRVCCQSVGFLKDKFWMESALPSTMMKKWNWDTATRYFPGFRIILCWTILLTTPIIVKKCWLKFFGTTKSWVGPTLYFVVNFN